MSDKNFFFTLSFVAVFGSGIWDEQKSGSGINILDPDSPLRVVKKNYKVQLIILLGSIPVSEATKIPYLFRSLQCQWTQYLAVPVNPISIGCRSGSGTASKWRCRSICGPYLCWKNQKYICQHCRLKGDNDTDPDPAQWCGSDPLWIRFRNTGIRHLAAPYWLQHLNTSVGSGMFIPDQKYSWSASTNLSFFTQNIISNV